MNRTGRNTHLHVVEDDGLEEPAGAGIQRSLRLQQELSVLLYEHMKTVWPQRWLKRPRDHADQAYPALVASDRAHASGGSIQAVPFGAENYDLCSLLRLAE